MKITRDYQMRGYNIFIGDINIKEAGRNMEYYELQKDDRWLGADSPYEIGGRSTDILQIAFSLEDIVKNLYPINEVPDAIATALKELAFHCRETEERIEKFIALVTEIRQETK